MPFAIRRECFHLVWEERLCLEEGGLVRRASSGLRLGVESSVQRYCSFRMFLSRLQFNKDLWCSCATPFFSLFIPFPSISLSRLFPNSEMESGWLWEIHSWLSRHRLSFHVTWWMPSTTATGRGCSSSTVASPTALSVSSRSHSLEGWPFGILYPQDGGCTVRYQRLSIQGKV